MEPAQHDVGKERLARGVDALEQPLVERVEPWVVGRPAPGPEPENNRAERDGCDALPVGIGVDPVGEQPPEPDVLAEPRLDAGSAERAENHPEFQRAETAAELRSPV